MKRAIVCILLVALGLSLSLAQDDAARDKQFEDLLKSASTAYKAGKYSDSIASLQKALAMLRELAGADYASFLPKAGEGWKAGEPDVSSGTWGAGKDSFQIMTVSQSYRREKDGREVDLTITNSPQLTSGPRQFVEMLKQPGMAAMLAQSDPGKTIKTFEDGAWAGLVQIEKAKSVQLMAMTKSLMVTVAVNADDEKLATEFWQAINRKGLAEAAATGK